MKKQRHFLFSLILFVGTERFWTTYAFIATTSNNDMQQLFRSISYHPTTTMTRNTNEHVVLKASWRDDIYDNDDDYDDKYDDYDNNNDNNDIPKLPALGASSPRKIKVDKSSSTPFTASFIPTDSSNYASNSTTATTTGTAFVSSKFELQYTCKVCDTRNRNIISRLAYREGMVISICKGCQSKHWIADNLDPTLKANNIEELLYGNNDNIIHRVNKDVYEIERVWEFTAGQMKDEHGKPVLE